MTLTAEQLEIQALAREFAEKELRPHAPEWDQARALDDGVFAKLAEVGFLGMTIPEEHGGLGLDPLTYLLVLEELAWGDAAVALSVAVHNGLVAATLVRHGTPDQKRDLLPALASGQRLGAFALSEPQAGSDVGAVATTAERDGAGWRLTGEKRWVTNGARAGLAVTDRRTEAGGVPGRASGLGLDAPEPRADDGVQSVRDRVGRPVGGRRARNACAGRS